MSISNELRMHWAGMSSEDIGASFPQRSTAEEVDAEIAEDLDKLNGRIVEAIAERAMEGNLEAVAWLEARGLVTLPKMDEGFAPHEPPPLVGPGEPGHVPVPDGDD